MDLSLEAFLFWKAEICFAFELGQGLLLLFRNRNCYT